MGATSKSGDSYEYEPWYKYGVAFLFFEASIAIGVSIYALSMAFSGQAVQFKKKVTFDNPPAAVEAEAAAREKQDHSTITVPGKQE